MFIGSSLPVMAGLAIGIAFVVLFSTMLKPDFMLTDKELISKYSELAEVKYYLEKYPDAKAEVNRNPNENYLEISYSVERQVTPRSDLYTGINTFAIHVYTKPNHLSLGVSCGVYHGLTIGVGIADIESIDEAEKNCFEAGVFEPDDSLAGAVFVSEEK